MAKRNLWEKNYHSKAWYKRQIDEFFKGNFLMELGVPVSSYLQTCEMVDQQLQEEHQNEKKQLRESIRFFKQLKKSNPQKYQKVMDMMGWDLEKGV